jgi:hypothetical protein
LISRGSLNVVPLLVCLFWSAQCLRILSLTPLPPTPTFFNIFQYIFIHPLPSHLVACNFTVPLSFFSFLSFPEFHRVVLLLQTCSTTEFVCDHVCFCVYVYLSFCLPCMRGNMCLLCFWGWLISLNMMSSNCTHLPSKWMSFFLVAD